MNIIEALTLLEKNQNKTIRRKEEPTYTYKMDRGVIYTPFNNEEVGFFRVCDILANDWEMVE